jgi:hypothetical protein
MRSPGLQLLSNDGMTPLTENVAAGIKEVPAIVTIPITGALYEWMKDEQHKVRLCGINIFIDMMTVEAGVYEESATTEEKQTVSVWVPENEEGEEIAENKTIQIPATSFVVADVQEEEIVKIKASSDEPTQARTHRAGLDASDISILKKGTNEQLVPDENISVSSDGSGYEFTVTSDIADILKSDGFEIKNNTAKNIKVKAIEVQHTGGGTAISGVNATILKGTQIFTISGQRVEKAHKGLYIVNGRKVVIK